MRNLGFLFDAKMSMSSHINSLISSVNYHLRNVHRISKFLDQDTKHAVVRSFTLSRFDDVNALLYGAKSKDLDHLQSLQHKAIKLMFSANVFDSPTPLTKTLHCLPIRERINFKICICMSSNAFMEKTIMWSQILIECYPSICMCDSPYAWYNASLLLLLLLLLSLLLLVLLLLLLLLLLLNFMLGNYSTETTKQGCLWPKPLQSWQNVYNVSFKLSKLCRRNTLK